MFISFDSSGRPKSLLARIAGALCAALAFAVALMFSLVLFAVLALAALAFWGYWRWKTRALREAMRGQRFEMPGGNAANDAPRGATIIEGEAVRVEEDRPRLK
ncbi:MAG: hypothetical protein LBI87_01115 [Candidatus Accumulibacter sp.]|jgi:hypothetical protein|nr:hypothetical protein [Accumulibacter sp.]